MEKHRGEIEAVKRESAGEAMEKLASVLLNLDELPVTAKTAPSLSRNADARVEEKPEEVAEIAEIQDKEDEVAGEAWVESFRCTSCNDCTDQFPAIFAYNEEKQAYVKDASRGTFEQLVMAAESCPASCIHPGAPLNPGEANLEELIARASKYI